MRVGVVEVTVLIIVGCLAVDKGLGVLADNRAGNKPERPVNRANHIVAISRPSRPWGVPPGWKRVQSPDSSMSIGAPADWKARQVSTQVLARSLEATTSHSQFYKRYRDP